MGDQDKNAMDTTRPAPPKMRSSTTVKKEDQDAQGYPEPGSQASGSASTTAWLQTQDLIKEMVGELKNLREEIAEVKEERPRKKTTEQKEDSEYSMVSGKP